MLELHLSGAWGWVGTDAGWGGCMGGWGTDLWLGGAGRVGRPVSLCTFDVGRKSRSRSHTQCALDPDKVSYLARETPEAEPTPQSAEGNGRADRNG